MILTALATLAIVSFILHLAWEWMHIVLYKEYDAMKGRLPVFVSATFGDVLYTLLAVLTISLFKGGIIWIAVPQTSDLIGLMLVGLWIAVFVEYKAKALNRWKYTSEMPTMGEIGLSPVAQMTILLPFSVFTTAIILQMVY